MKKINIISLLFLILFINSGCSTYDDSDYMKKRSEAIKILPIYESSYIKHDCFNLQFKFINNMPFNKNDANNMRDCINIENNRNKLRWAAKGVIEDDELAAKYAYESNRAIFTFLEKGEITLQKARELYNYTAKKSNIDAQLEMEQSNRLVSQSIENQRRAIEQENRDRYLLLQSMIQTNASRTPVVTTCDSLGGTLFCTSK